MGVDESTEPEQADEYDTSERAREILIVPKQDLDEAIALERERRQNASKYPNGKGAGIYRI